MMTEAHINSNHVLNSGLNTKSEIDKMDDVGWKAKLKIPPKDKRIKTSVSYILQLFYKYYYKHISFLYNFINYFMYF